MRNFYFLISWFSLLFYLPVTISIVQSPLRVSLFAGKFRGDTIQRPESSSSFNRNSIPEISVWILSKFGSNYLDRKLKLQVSPNATIEMIKEMISTQFPGKPPKELLNLYFGIKKVNNSQQLHEISHLRVIPLQLDLISGTNSYQNIRNVQEAVEAAVALQVHQTFLDHQIQQLLLSENGFLRNNSTPLNVLFIELFQTLNSSIYDTHRDDLEKARDAEREPPSLPPMVNFRGATTDSLGYSSIDEYLNSKTYLERKFFTSLSMNKQIFRSLVLYSLVWLAHGFYETEIPIAGRMAFFAFVPLIWLQQLRIVRYPLRLLKIFFLSSIAKIPLFLQLFPAQYQVLAHSTRLNSPITTRKSLFGRLWSHFSEWIQLRILRIILWRAQRSLPLATTSTSPPGTINEEEYQRIMDLFDDESLTEEE